MLRADTWTGGAGLAGRPLKFGVGAFAAAAFALAASVADLAVAGDAGGGVHGAVAGAAGVVGVADALSALTTSVTWTQTAATELLQHKRRPDGLFCWKHTTESRKCMLN